MFHTNFDIFVVSSWFIVVDVRLELKTGTNRVDFLALRITKDCLRRGCLGKDFLVKRLIAQLGDSTGC